MCFIRFFCTRFACSSPKQYEIYAILLGTNKQDFERSNPKILVGVLDGSVVKQQPATLARRLQEIVYVHYLQVKWEVATKRAGKKLVL
jgi:hypothetical protein